MNIAIVTGAGSGLGRFLAAGLAEDGLHVIAADVDAAAAAETARLTGGTAVRCDVTSRAEAEALIARAVEAGGPHVLINNAGGWTPGVQFPDAEPEAWGRTLDLNLRAPMHLTQLALAPMARLGGGAIVNIASSAGSEETPYGSPEYGAAKAGLIRFTTALGAPDRIGGTRVTCLVPNWIGLDRAHAELAAMSPEERAQAAPLIPPSKVVAAALGLLRAGAGGTVLELVGA
ncbi:3-oxoacyl-ACP reductase [Paractinoplanes abujensis]|uniref:3-oxoacyl-[acyl-carrier protein] reductase n=1 Tax=Paractinoplanes abujensis TaxID=882441 RepID=A0A7W7G4E5_9ACTN|nr:SDR family oxidoreductase [Actinoplanes abujensis]MBB4695559.1 3-oxoacyl-[acyl-carrier protein] reductase [Actinoplanes abujensis]GID23143.1 3-oxoacyl-ACP reductase [Actinoplanes abujensis]